MCKVCSSLGQKWGNERAITGSKIILTSPLSGHFFQDNHAQFYLKIKLELSLWTVYLVRTRMQSLDNISIIIFQMIYYREVVYSTKTLVKINQHCEESIFRLLKIYGLNIRKNLMCTIFFSYFAVKIDLIIKN